MRVAVQGHADRGVPEQVLDELRVRAAREQERGRRVPQVMPAYVRQTGTLQQGLEVAVDNVLRFLKLRCFS